MLPFRCHPRYICFLCSGVTLAPTSSRRTTERCSRFSVTSSVCQPRSPSKHLLYSTLGQLQLIVQKSWRRSAFNFSAVKLVVCVNVHTCTNTSLYRRRLRSWLVNLLMYVRRRVSSVFARHNFLINWEVEGIWTPEICACVLFKCSCSETSVLNIIG